MAKHSSSQPHSEQHTEVELSANLETLLSFLFEHPEESHSTDSLAASLDDLPRSTDEVVAELKAASDGETQSPVHRKRNPEDVERDIEILIFKGLVAGQRTGAPGAIRYEGVSLTAAGERRAIAVRNPAVKVTLKQELPKRVYKKF